jgi:hypothetical protein
MKLADYEYVLSVRLMEAISSTPRDDQRRYCNSNGQSKSLTINPVPAFSTPGLQLAPPPSCILEPNVDYGCTARQMSATDSCIALHPVLLAKLHSV